MLICQITTIKLFTPSNGIFPAGIKYHVLDIKLPKRCGEGKEGEGILGASALEN